MKVVFPCARKGPFQSYFSSLFFPVPSPPPLQSQPSDLHCARLRPSLFSFSVFEMPPVFPRNLELGSKWCWALFRPGRPFGRPSSGERDPESFPVLHAPLLGRILKKCLIPLWCCGPLLKMRPSLLLPASSNVLVLAHSPVRSLLF